MGSSLKKRTFTLGILLICLALIQVSIIAYAQAEMMPRGEVKVGMKGIGKTVIAGTTIETFDVEILSIVKGQSPAGDLFLCRVSGPVIDQSGGIAAGMSGSPVYVDGKVVGAIGYSWSLTDHRLGLITPIETMMKVLTLDQTLTDPERKILPKKDEPIEAQTTSFAPTDSWVQLTEPILVGDQTIAQVYFTHSYGEAVSVKQDPATLLAYPVRTPLLVSGMSGRALERLMSDLKQYDLVPVTTGMGTADSENGQILEPGSAISAQLVRGDVEISALGTLTYRDDDAFVAFGHPFMKLGTVEYFLSGAEVITVVNNLDMPFKLGVAGKPQGVVTQDRNAGIGGYLNRVPTIVPVSITVHDLDMDLTRTMEFQVVRDEELMTSLIVNATLQAVDTVMDRQGYGTSAVEIEILGDKLPEHMVKYSNMYYSPEDIAGASLGDLFSLLQVVVSNPFEQVNVGSIHVKLDVMRTRQYAILEEVKLLNDELRPGERAQLEVTLRPYRGEPFTQVVEVQLPENIQPGSASLMVSGGIFGLYEQMEGEPEQNGKQSGDGTSAIGEHYKSLDEILQVYLKQPKNHELVVDIMQYAGESEDVEEVGLKEEEDGSSEKTTKVISVKPDQDRDQPVGSSEEQATEPVTVHETFWTAYVLEGSLHLEILILDPLDDEMGNGDMEEDDSSEGNQVNSGG